MGTDISPADGAGTRPTTDAAAGRPPGLTPFVGRERERRRLEAAAERPRAGVGAAVLLGGPAGVGKTRLAQETLAALAGTGYRTLVSRASPLDGDLPYASLVQALGAVLRDETHDERDRLTAGLPALRLLFEDLDAPAPTPLRDAHLDRLRLFEAVLRLVDRLSRRAPVAWLVDDLHDLDGATLALLAHLTRDLPGLPVLLLVTYRPEELEKTGNAARDLVQFLRRSAAAEDVALAPLTAADVRALLERRLGGAPPPRLPLLMAERSGGLPLFVEALADTLLDRKALVRRDGRWRLLEDPAVGVPPVVAEAVRGRLRMLDDDDLRVLQAVAVGGDVPVTTLAAATGVTAPDAALARLAQRALLRDGAAAAAGALHPLVQEIVVAETPIARRRRLHAAFAAHYERVAPDDVERLAHHHRGALPEVDATRAFEVCFAAGRRALARFATGAASRHLETASDLMAGRPRHERIEVLTLLGEARIRAADLVGARTAWEHATGLLRDDDSPVEAAQLHRRLAEALIDWGALDEAEEHIDAGLAALRDAPPTELHQWLALSRQYSAYQQNRPDDVEDAARVITDLALQIGTPEALALQDAARGLAAYRRGELELAFRVVPGAHARLATDTPRFAMREHGFHAAIAAARGDLPALRSANRAALAAARRIGVSRSSFRIQIYAFVEAFYEGDWDRAQEVVFEAELSADRIAHPRIALVAPVSGVVLDSAMGDLDGARTRLRRLREGIDIGRVPSVRGEQLHGVLSGLIALEAGDAAGALHAVADLDDLLPSLLPPWGWIVRGVAQATLGDARGAFSTAEDLARLGSTSSYPGAASLRIEGLAQATSGLGAPALARLERSREIFTRLGMPFEAARTAVEAAEIAVPGALDAPDLPSLVDAAYTTLSGLGARRWADRARRLLKTLERPLPSETGDADLTPRQREVAELVATGRTNAEIAEHLVLSVRTVDSHLDHIYTRLGISSRAALAAYVTAQRSFDGSVAAPGRGRVP